MKSVVFFPLQIFITSLKNAAGTIIELKSFIVFSLVTDSRKPSVATSVSTDSFATKFTPVSTGLASSFDAEKSSLGMFLINRSVFRFCFVPLRVGGRGYSSVGSVGNAPFVFPCEIFRVPSFSSKSIFPFCKS